MKRFLMISLVAVGLAILIAGFTVAVFAHDPDAAGATPASDEVWEGMYQACTEGDWEAMIEAAKEVHGEDFSYMPCHDEDNYGSTGGWDSMGSHMRGGMMGGGWGGMY